MGNLLFYVQQRRLLTVLVAVLVAIFSLSASVDAKFIETASIDGPGTGTVDKVYDVALSPDGKSGGVVYLKQDGGKDHVFFAPIVDGKSGSPKRIDVGQVNDSSIPSVTASNGGKIGVYWINNVALNVNRAYYAGSMDSGTAFSAPTQIGTQAAVNTIYADANAAGIVYVSLGSNSDVYGYRFDGSTWNAISGEGKLEQNTANEAGSRATLTESRVAVTPDGNAYLAWSEGAATPDEAYARYLSGTTAGSAVRLDQGFPSGQTESAGAPFSRRVRLRVDGQGNAKIAIEQFIDYGGANKSRAFVRTMNPAGSLGPLVLADGLGSTPPGDGENGIEFAGGLMNQIGFAINDAGSGLLAAQRTTGDRAIATRLLGDSFSSPFVSLAAKSQGGIAVTIGSETDQGFYAWNDANDKKTYVRESTPADIAVTAQQISNDSFGEGGIPLAAADRFGNGVIAFKQGNDRVVFSVLDQPPSAPEFITTNGAELEAGIGKIEWKPSNEAWGDVNYTVKIDGKQIASGTQTSAVVPADTLVGTRTVSVEAVDREGQSAGTISRQVVVRIKPGVNPLVIKSMSFKKDTISVVIFNQSSTLEKLVVGAKSKNKLRVKVKKRTTRRTVVFGVRRVNLSAGTTLTAKIKLSKTNLKLLRKLRKIPTNIRIDIAGQPTSQAIKKQFTLRAPGRS